MNAATKCSLLATADQRAASKFPALYLAEYHHKNTSGQSIDVLSRPYQIEILKDDSQHLVIMKCVQVGISEILIIKAMAKLYQGWAIIYSLPIESLRNTFVANRIDKMIMMVPLYKQWLEQATGDSDQVGMKHFLNGVIKLVGSNSKSSFLEFPADMVIIDEKDKSDLDNLELAEDRLQASEHKFKWEVGNPTFGKFGMHKAYLNSDQKRWNVKCLACNEWQDLDFFKNIVQQINENEYQLIGDDTQAYCRKCSKPIDRLMIGQWVAKYPDRSISGYHVNQLFSPTVSIAELWHKFLEGQTNATVMQVFYNSCLGLPYEAVGDNLSAALLESKCMDDYLMPSTAKGCTIGIDVNWPQLNVRISEYPKPGIRKSAFIGIVHSFDEVTSLLNRYNVKIGCIDVAPERHRVAEFQKQHRNIWAVNYAGEIPEFWRVKDDERYITVDRTQAIDAMVSEILNERNRLPKNFRSLDGGKYIEQMEAPKRILDIARKRYKWEEFDTDDHHFHADVYDFLAMRVLRDIGDRMPRLTVVTVCD